MELLQKHAEEAEAAEDLQTAFELWKELAAKNNKEPFFFLRFGRAAQKLQLWNQAEAAFSQALSLDPTSSLIMENLGSLWASRSDKDKANSFETARTWFMRALEQDRNTRLLTQLGAACTVLNDLIEARNAFEEALRIDPNYEEALYNLAVLEEDISLQKSAKLLEQAIQIDPDYAIAHQALGRVHQKMGDLIRAEYHFRRSLEIDPADYWSNIYMANLLGVQGRNAEAEQTYRFATNLHPEIAGGFEIFGRFLESIGKDEEAEKTRLRLRR